MKKFFTLLLGWMLLSPAAMAQSSDAAQVYDLATEAREVLLELHRKHKQLRDKNRIAMQADAERLDQLLFRIQQITDANLSAPRPPVAADTHIQIDQRDEVAVTVQIEQAPPAPPPPPPTQVIVVEKPVPATPEPRCNPMAPRRFSALIDAMSNESFQDGKHLVLSDASRDASFNTQQVIQLMSQFSFDDDKVQAAASLYPAVCDQRNWFTVYSSLTFDSSREELRQRVGR